MNNLLSKLGLVLPVKVKGIDPLGKRYKVVSYHGAIEAGVGTELTEINKSKLDAHKSSFSYQSSTRIQSPTGTDIFVLQPQRTDASPTLVPKLANRNSDSNLTRKFNLKKYTKPATYDKHEYYIQLKILKSLKHKNLLRLKSIYEDSNHIYFIYTLTTYRPILSVLKDPIEPYTEKLIASWAYQLLLGLKYLHDHGVTHANLDLNSILVDGKKLLICNYEGNKLRVAYPNEVYGPTTAPEILERKGYGQSADLYSLGAILHFLFFGYYPNPPPSTDISSLTCTEELDNSIRLTSCSLKPSQQALIVIHQLLQPNPIKRLTVDQAIHHVWLNGISKEIGGGLERSSSMRSFRKSLLFITN